MLEVTSREVTKQDKSYSPLQLSPMYHSCKQQKHPPERYLLDPLQRITYQPEVNLPENIEMDFPEGQFGKEIEKKSSYQANVIEQEYNRTTKTLQSQPRIKTAN